MDGLYRSAARLKHALIEHDDALEIIERYDTPETLFYIDPPYVLDTRNNRKRYAYEMTDDDHCKLADVLRTVRGMVVLSGYASELYAELYDDWKMLTKSTTTNGNNTAIECLWLSPSTQRAQTPLFNSWLLS